MSLLATISSVLLLAMIIGGLLLLKKSAKSFNLSTAQKQKIKERNEQLAKEDDDQ